MDDEDPQSPQQRQVDPYADLYAKSRASADPYADLYDGASPHRQANDPGGDVVLGGNPSHPIVDLPSSGEVRTIINRPRPLVPPVMAPRDVTAIPLTARTAYRPSLPERAAAQVGQFASEAARHPLTTALGLVKAPVASLLTSTGGALERGFTDPNAEPDRRAISDEDYTNANAQTLANTAFGPLEGAVASRAVSAGAGPIASKLLGLTVAGAPAGAAYSPGDPAAGAAAGAILAAVLGATHEGVVRGAPKLVDAAGKGARVAGRAVSGAAGKLVDALPNLTDRADPYADLTRQRTEAAQLDQLPTLDQVNAAHAELRAQHATATDPHTLGELESRLSMVEAMRRKLTGEPEPKVATADAARAAKAAGVRSIDTPPRVATNADGVPPITQAPTTFKTALGSDYELHDDGTTTRNKAPRAGHPDSGPQSRSERTVFVDDAGLQALGEVQAHGASGSRRIALLPDGRIGLRYDDGPNAGQFEGRTVIRPQTTPAPGLYPVELWNDGREVHFGNRITEVGSRVAGPEEMPQRGTQPTPSPYADAENAGNPEPAALSSHESLARFAPTMYHETSIDRALGLLGDVHEDLTGRDLFLANTPELARGQGNNTGVRIEFDASNLRGAEHTGKPGLAFTRRQGASEFTARNPQAAYSDAVRSIEVRPDAYASNAGYARRLHNVVLPALEREGWTTEKYPNGSVRYTRPGAEPQTALRGTQEPAGATETPSPYSDLFGEKAPEKIEQGGLFGEQAGTEGSRPLANAERAARSELDQLRTKYDGTTDPAARQEIAARMSPLEKLTNRGEKIGAEEMGRRAVAAGTEADPYGDLTGERKEPAAPKAPSVPDDWFGGQHDAPAKTSGVVLEDGAKRFESARSPGGTRRNPERVSTTGLFDELLDLEKKRADAQARAVYEVREDPNFHTSGIPQIVSTKPKGGGASRQAKAAVNLDAFARAQSEIEAALSKRGIAGDMLTDLLQEHHAEREERRALSGDFDPRNLNRGQVKNETGDVLFSQTPESFGKGGRGIAGRIRDAIARGDESGVWNAIGPDRREQLVRDAGFHKMTAAEARDAAWSKLQPAVKDAMRPNVRAELARSYTAGGFPWDRMVGEDGTLASQTPDAFKGEPPTRTAGVEIAQSRAEQGGTPSPSRLSAPRQALAVASMKANAFKDAAQRVFAPASRSEDAGRIALAIREHGGDFARRNEQAREAFKEMAGTFDRMPDPERLDFIDRIETGRPQSNPTLQAAADLMRRLLDDGRDAIRALGTGKLEHWIQNYFPHLWENEADAVSFTDRVMSKKSLSGPGTFLKRRSIPTLKEGIEAGLEPLTTNPVDMTLLKLREMNKYLAGQRILAEMKEMGFAKFVSALAKAPDSLVKLDDKLGTVYAPPEVQVTEGYDKLVREKLTSVMQELGVTHTRKANIGGRGRMGFAQGDSRITTKAGGPDTVIEHELGHILDAKLGVWDRLTDIPGKTREAIDARKQLHGELRALADMRYEGMNPDGLPESFKDYVRKKEEKIANAVHALVYMPDRMEEVAPMVKERLTSILKNHPVASKLLEVKPSLVLGTSDYAVPVGGLVVRGHWYVPEPVARVVNNYLSPGLRGNPFYDLYRGVGNSMNQWQLGFSAFHLGFTSMDAAVSKTALAVEQLAQGRPIAALRSAAESPIAPISNYLRGSKVLREYLKPGTEGGEMAQLVGALTQAGGRVRQDAFYGGGAVKRFREAMTRGQVGKAARLSLGAITEASSHLVMEHIVPRQKLGVFADLARFELSKLPENATKDQVRAAMAHAWDSVDNRMGQLVYDNLFWHRAAKDLTMASVRSVGWNVGTFRELGGGVADLQALPRRLTHRAFKAAHLPGDWQGASEPLELGHRAAYVVALPITVGLAGGIMNYLYTGEAPRELKDWFYPRTGRKNPDGTEERVQLPSYMRDVGDVWRHPVQTVVNKLHPLAGTIREMLQNEDYYGHEIHNPDDPMVRQLAQQATYLAGQFEPFGIHNARQQLARGQKGDALLNAVGITPAPREETRTPADLRMSGELGRRAAGRLTPEEVDRQQERRSIVGAMRSHDPKVTERVQGAIQHGSMTPKDLKPMLKQSVLPPDVQRFKQLPLAEAMRVFQLATPEEKKRYGPVLIDKMNHARTRGTLPSVLPPGLFSPQ